MSVKIIKTESDKNPITLGIECLPLSYQAPARAMAEQYASAMTAYKPYHLGSLAKLVRETGSDLDAQVDADLLDDFHEIAIREKRPLGTTLYRLDTHMLPV